MVEITRLCHGDRRDEKDREDDQDVDQFIHGCALLPVTNPPNTRALLCLLRTRSDVNPDTWRIPALEMERVLVGAAKAFLDDRPAVLAALHESEIEIPDFGEGFQTRIGVESAFVARD